MAVEEAVQAIGFFLRQRKRHPTRGSVIKIVTVIGNEAARE